MSLRTTGLAVISAPISRAEPVTTLKSALRQAGALGQNGDGERRERRLRRPASTTMAQPAAKAGPALRVIIALGKFQGVIAATTPIGCFITMMRLSG